MRWITKRPLTEWILAFTKLLFLPIGRIGRLDFLISFICLLLIVLVGIYWPSTAVEFKKLGVKIVGITAPPGKEYISQIINISAILCIWILLVNTIKRLRDLDTKLWYAVFVLIAPINLLVLLGLLLSEGSPGTNQYGPPKKTLSL